MAKKSDKRRFSDWSNDTVVKLPPKTNVIKLPKRPSK